jgi:hypothetical protein
MVWVGRALLYEPDDLNGIQIIADLYSSAFPIPIDIDWGNLSLSAINDILGITQEGDWLLDLIEDAQPGEDFSDPHYRGPFYSAEQMRAWIEETGLRPLIPHILRLQEEGGRAIYFIYVDDST